MANHIFLSKDNINLLWDVIADEDIFKQCAPDAHVVIHNVFYNNIQSFFDNEKNNTFKLVDMNKKYIMLLLNFINTNILRASTKPTATPPVNPTKQLVTRDDIQTDKRSQIEKDFDLRQKEFTSAMSIPVPPVPKFNDEVDLPIGQMEEAIRLMSEQRKYDTDQFNKGYTTTDDDWLKPKETSVKNEKFQTPTKMQTIYKTPSQPSIKYIKIDTTDIDDNKNYVIDLLEKPQTHKHISWSDEQPQQLFDDTSSLFKKLKRVEQNTHEQEVELLKKNVELLNTKVETMNQSLNNILEILTKK